MSGDTQKLFLVRYTDASDFGCPVFVSRLRAWNAEHAEERFLDAPDGDGWRILSVEPAPNAR